MKKRGKVVLKWIYSSKKQTTYFKEKCFTRNSATQNDKNTQKHFWKRCCLRGFHFFLNRLKKSMFFRGRYTSQIEHFCQENVKKYHFSFIFYTFYALPTNISVSNLTEMHCFEVCEVYKGLKYNLFEQYVEDIIFMKMKSTQTWLLWS